MKTGINGDVIDDMLKVARMAEETYGPYTSTHEALGVIAEEIWELTQAIRLGYSESVRQEAIDVAVAALRLARQCRGFESFDKRSGFND